MCDCSASYFSAALASRLIQIAEVLRPTDQKDRFGAVSGDKTRVVHRYKCRVIYDNTANPTLIGDKSQVRSEWRILLPLGSDVATSDTIAVEGQIFEVLDTDAGRSGASFLTLFVRKSA